MVDGDDCSQFYVEREVVVAQHDQKRLPSMARAIQNESRRIEKREIEPAAAATTTTKTPTRIQGSSDPLPIPIALHKLSEKLADLFAQASKVDTSPCTTTTKELSVDSEKSPQVSP